jgi:hypothetical protein
MVTSGVQGSYNRHARRPRDHLGGPTLASQNGSGTWITKHSQGGVSEPSPRMPERRRGSCQEWGDITNVPQLVAADTRKASRPSGVRRAQQRGLRLHCVAVRALGAQEGIVRLALRNQRACCTTRVLLDALRASQQSRLVAVRRSTQTIWLCRRPLDHGLHETVSSACGRRPQRVEAVLCARQLPAKGLGECSQPGRLSVAVTLFCHTARSWVLDLEGGTAVSA